MSRLPPMDADVAVLLDRLDPPPLSPDFADRVIAATAADEIAPLVRLRKPGWRRRIGLAFAVGSVLSVAAAASVAPDAFRKLPVVAEIVGWLGIEEEQIPPMARVNADPDAYAGPSERGLPVIVDMPLVEPTTGNAPFAAERPARAGRIDGSPNLAPEADVDAGRVRESPRSERHELDPRETRPTFVPQRTAQLPDAGREPDETNSAREAEKSHEPELRDRASETETVRTVEEPDGTAVARVPEAREPSEARGASEAAETRQILRERQATTPVRRPEVTRPRRIEPGPRIRTR